jgi:starch phosphorylase
MEIALQPVIPTYSGGLGILAGDTIRSFADLGIQVIAVSLLHRQGFFEQALSPTGQQIEKPDPWEPEGRLEPVKKRVGVEVGGRTVQVAAWRYTVEGVAGDSVPVYLLDTRIPANHPDDQSLTDDLYMGDERHRLRQEMVLGLGGAALLVAICDEPIHRYHLNEGHAALVGLWHLERHLEGGKNGDLPRLSTEEALARTRAQCVFTTHTPVPAGHDRFPLELARELLGDDRIATLETIGIKRELNMTELALYCSRYVNGVAVRHGEISRSMFPDYPIRSITNGVHASTWVAPDMHDLYDRFIPGWPADPFALRYANQIPAAELEAAHARSKQNLLDRVRALTGRVLDPAALTIGFARRATGYKRSSLVFRDIERLRMIAERHGKLQFVFAGKAHPHDDEGKHLIEEVFAAGDRLRGDIEVVYLPDYGMELGLLLTSGSDVWLNNPTPPLEASGTSGMKAALNGVPSLSILDGWWVEGCVEGVTGWEIENGALLAGEDQVKLDAHHADALYRKLDTVVAPLYFTQPEQMTAVRLLAISLNGSFFNTHRMALQYLYEAYLPL